jgi:hypothetical protein
VNSNCPNDSRVDCEFLFNLVKLNEKGIEFIVNLKSLKIQFEHDEIVNTEICGGIF